MTGATVTYATDSNSSIQFQANPPALSNGIIGGYAYYDNADFATITGTSSPYTIGVAAYTTGNLAGLSLTGTENVKLTGTQGSLTKAITINSLNLTGTNGVTMTGTGAITLASGGLIANSSSGNISGGTLTAAGGELIVNTVQHLTIARRHRRK